MPSPERSLRLLLVLGVLGAPALLLRVMCVGQACRVVQAAPARVPFCSLPAEVRSGIAAGFRDGRSPDVLAVTGPARVRGGSGLGGDGPAWPSASSEGSARVPIILWGSGIATAGRLPEGSRLADVAPTVAEVIGFRVPHPEVRSGEPLEAAASGEDRPRLVLQVVWKGIGTPQLESAPQAWPSLRSLLEAGVGTLEGLVGFVPLDPAAVLTTIGTGGSPSEHGITGTLIRDGSTVVRAWGPQSPPSVIATLADDLDQQMGQEPRIGLVATDPADRGAIGGGWYVEEDRDDVVVVRAGPGRIAERAAGLLRSGYGTDDIPDLLVVVMEGPVGRLDTALDRLVREAEAVSGGSVAVVVTATGDQPLRATGLDAAEVGRAVDRRVSPGEQVVEGVAVGGLFLNQRVLGRTGISADEVLRALRGIRTHAGERLMADVFPGIAVSLSRYC